MYKISNLGGVDSYRISSAFFKKRSIFHLKPCEKEPRGKNDWIGHVEASFPELDKVKVNVRWASRSDLNHNLHLCF